MRLMGLFKHEDAFLEAAGKLKASGFDQITLMSPIPVHGAEQVLGDKPNRIRFFSFAGAILGGSLGFLLAAGSALTFILPTGGRPIITIPPFLVITYEMTILLGVLATLLGFHVVSGLPAWRDKPYDPATNVDRFAVLVAVGSDRARAEEIIRSAGAEEVRAVEEVET